MCRLNEEKRIRICTLLEESIYSPSDLARKYKVILTQRTERRAARYIISGECSTAVQVQKKLQVDHKIEVSAETVHRAFKKNDLKSMVKVKKPLLLPRHKKARYEFAKKYKHWKKGGAIEGSACKRNNKVWWRWCFQFVWGCFTAQGIGYLCRIDSRMDAELYCKILEEDFLMTLDYYDLDVVDVVFQHDNDPKHKARITTDWLETNNINVLDWLAQSPDLNPIENLWSELERRLRKDGSIIITNKTSLWEKIQTSWNNIETEVCTKLIETMPRRIEDVIKQKGGYTKW
ncbi:unnamed protein product [Rhizophagus irregularis]|nr:unnamed protein product [Rhizophagus irregularis]